MATTASILSILVDANTGSATAKLDQFNRQIETTRANTRQALQAKLGASFDPAAFAKYDEKLTQTQRRVADKAAFKAALGGDYNASAFNAYERQLNQTQRATVKADETTRHMTGSTRGLSGSFGGLAMTMGSVLTAFVSLGAIKDAIGSTVALTEATAKLTATTGMDAKTASSWIEVMKARGVQAGMVQMGFITLAKQVMNAEEGSRKSAAAFDRLGVSMATLRTGDTSKIILGVADGFARIPDPLQRAALAQTIFGRNAKALIPILAGGSAGIRAALMDAQRYGAYIGGDANAKLQRYKESLFDFKYALDGLKVTFTEALLPYLGKAVTAIDNFIVQVRSGKGAGGEFGKIVSTAFHMVADAVGRIVSFLGGFGNFVKLVGVLVGTLMAFKAIQGLISVATALTNPWTLALAAVAVAVYLILTHWKELVKFFQTTGQPIVKAFSDAFAKISRAAEDAWARITKAFGGGGGKGGGIDWMKVLGGAVDTIAWIVTESAREWAIFITVVSAVMATVVSVVRDAASMASTAWSTASAVFTSVAQTLSKTFGPVVTAVMQGVNSILGPIGQLASAVWAALQPFIGIISQVGGAWQTLTPIIAGVMIEIGILVTAGWQIVQAAFQAAWRAIQVIMNALAGVIQGAFQVIRGVIQVFTGLFTLDFTKMWQGVKNIFSGSVTALVSIVRGIYGLMNTAGVYIMKGLGAGITAVWQTLKNIVSTIADSLVKVVEGIWNAMFNAGKFILGGIESGIKAAINGVLSVIVGFINAIISLIDKIPGVSIGKVGVPHLAQGGIVQAGAQTFASGGMVNSPGYFAGEESPLHPEVIIATNPAYRQRNIGLFAQAGAMLGIPGFAAGGIAGSAARTHGSILDILPGLPSLPKVPHLPGWISGLPGWLLDKAASFVKDKVGSLFSSVGGALGLGGGGGTSGANQALGKAMMLAAGWSASQWPALQALWTGESGWNANALNPSSGAAGIPQALGHGHVFNMGDARGQIAWGLNYIRSTYGSPSAAYSAWLGRSPHWYRQGGIRGNIQRFAGGGMHGGAGTGWLGHQLPVGGASRFMGSPQAGAGFGWGHSAWGTGGSGGSAGGSGGGGGIASGLAAGWQGSILGMPALPKLPGSVPSTIAGAGKVQDTINALRTKLSGLQHQYGTIDSYYNLSTLSLLAPDGSVDQTAVAQRVEQLQRLEGFTRQIFDTYQLVVAWTDRLVQANHNIVAQAKRRMAAANEVLKRLRNSLSHITTRGLKGAARTSAEKHQQDTKAAIAKYQKIAGLASGDIAKYTGNAASAAGDLMTAGDDRDSAWIDFLRVQGERLSTAATTAQPGLAAAAAAGPVLTSGASTPTVPAANVVFAPFAQTTDLLAQMARDVLAMGNQPLIVQARAGGGMISGSGWALVGERGPELAKLPSGTRIYSNAESGRMANSPTGPLSRPAGPLVNIENMNVASEFDERALADRLAFLLEM